MIQIRSFQPSDLSRLKEMTAEAFNGVSIDQGIEQRFGIINGHNWQWRKCRHIDEDVLEDASGIFIAELSEDDAIVGFITTWRDAESGFGHIPNLVVAAGHRGQGIGRQLIAFALDRFRAAGLTHARIETLVQNEVGCGLYQSMGFEEIARQIHFAMEL